MSNAINTTEERKDDKRWFYVSVIIHSIVVILLFIFPLFSYTYPPLEAQEGLLVRFGEPETGRLNDRPDTQQEKKVDHKTSASAESKSPSSQSSAKKVVTQDLPSEVSIKELKESEALSRKLEIEEAKKQQEIDRQKQIAEEERKKKEAEEAQKKAYQESKKQYSDLFKGKGNGSTSDAGNQGVEDGHEDASALKGLSTGAGTLGGGLGNRGVVSAPKVQENSQKKGIVVLKICVDPSGRVISSNYTQRGSTTTDADLVDLANKSAKKWKFSPGTIAKQCGTITFDFKVQ